MNTVVDRSILTMVIGPIIGLLVMKGFVAPANADQLSQSLEIFVGATIGLISVIVGLHHARESKKLDNTNSTQVTVTQQQPVVAVPEQPAV